MKGLKNILYYAFLYSFHIHGNNATPCYIDLEFREIFYSFDFIISFCYILGNAMLLLHLISLLECSDFGRHSNVVQSVMASCTPRWYTFHALFIPSNYTKACYFISKEKHKCRSISFEYTYIAFVFHQRWLKA